MVNKNNTQTDPIFQFTELTPKEYEMMPEEGLYLLRCKLPEDDWAGGCKKDMDYDLTKQIRHHGIGNWGKDGGFHVYSVAVSDNFKETDEVSLEKSYSILFSSRENVKKVPAGHFFYYCFEKCMYLCILKIVKI